MERHLPWERQVLRAIGRASVATALAHLRVHHRLCAHRDQVGRGKRLRIVSAPPPICAGTAAGQPCARYGFGARSRASCSR